MVSDHRVDRALQLRVASPDRLAHPAETVRAAELFELVVQVEDEGGQRRTPGDPRGPGVQPHDEECRPSHAESEVRVVRVRRDLRIPLLLVRSMQVSQLLPEQVLEVDLIGNLRRAKDSNQ